MTVLQFPATDGKPTDGSFKYVANGVVYSWDGEKWTAANEDQGGSSTADLQLVTDNGNTTTNSISIGSDLTLNTQDLATFSAVDTSGAGPNDYGTFFFKGVRQSDGDSQGYLELNSDASADFKGNITAAGDVAIGDGTVRDIPGFASIGLDGVAGAVTDYFVGGTRFGTIASDTNQFVVESVGSLPLTFSTSGSPKMQISDTGDVKIGGTFPDSSLIQLKGSDGSIAALGQVLSGDSTRAGTYSVLEPSGIIESVPAADGDRAFSVYSRDQLKRTIEMKADGTITAATYDLEALPSLPA